MVGTTCIVGPTSWAQVSFSSVPIFNDMVDATEWADFRLSMSRIEVKKVRVGGDGVSESRRDRRSGRSRLYHGQVLK